MLKRVVVGCHPVSVFLSVFVEGVRVERVVAELAGAGAAREVARPERRDGRRGRRAGLGLAAEGSGRRGCLVLAQGPQDEAVLAAGRSAEPGLGRRVGVQNLAIWKKQAFANLVPGTHKTILRYPYQKVDTRIGPCTSAAFGSLLITPSFGGYTRKYSLMVILPSGHFPCLCKLPIVGIMGEAAHLLSIHTLA